MNLCTNVHGGFFCCGYGAFSLKVVNTVRCTTLKGMNSIRSGKVPIITTDNRVATFFNKKAAKISVDLII
jgi:hypothetical protein